jgi:hypothetical protein
MTRLPNKWWWLHGVEESPFFRISSPMWHRNAAGRTPPLLIRSPVNNGRGEYYEAGADSGSQTRRQEGLTPNSNPTRGRIPRLRDADVLCPPRTRLVPVSYPAQFAFSTPPSVRECPCLQAADEELVDLPHNPTWLAVVRASELSKHYKLSIPN